MGNKFDILSSIMSTLLTLIFRNNLPSFDETQNFNYVVPDPNQMHKPENRTKDHISIKNINDPTHLDFVIN